MMRTIRSALPALTLLALVSCAAPKKGTLKLRNGPPDALVTIDDHYVGQLGQLPRGVRLKPGKHLITIEKVGQFPFDIEVEIKPERATEVEIELTPVPE